jgi:hypothetical protein
MGTRGAYGFRVNGKDFLMYNHFDSYPSGLGRQVVDFIRRNSDKTIGKLAKSLVVVDRDVNPTEAQKEMCRKAGVVDLSVSNKSENDWYCLLRKTQGDLSSLKKVPLIITSGNEFVADSLFCEYAYILNVDEGVLEVYRGFNAQNHGRKSQKHGRYAGLRLNDPDGTPSDYWGVVLVMTVPFGVVRKVAAAKLVQVMDAQVSLSLGSKPGEEDDGKVYPELASKFEPLVAGDECFDELVAAKVADKMVED